MRTEGKVSKVAICENCGGYVLACHVDFLHRGREKEFTQAVNDGFIVKGETIEETQQRQIKFWNDCKNGLCKTINKLSK